MHRRAGSVDIPLPAGHPTRVIESLTFCGSGPVEYAPTPSTMPSAAHRFWQRLMPALEERRVIPVIGQDLLTHDRVEPRMPLYTWVARRVAQQLGVRADSNVLSLNDLVCQHLERGGALDDVQVLLAEQLASRTLPVPAALSKLAQIDCFRLYVTLCPDPLLERALDAKKRGGGQTQSLSYRLGHDFDDLPDYLDHLSGPIVYYLFGRASPIRGSAALTDEDVLEFVHQLQAPERQPWRLFEAFAESHLLLVGSGFPDWLMRFFLRTVHQERLWFARGGFLADLEAVRDLGLSQFLQHYCRERLYDGTAHEFVEELWARWQERLGNVPAPAEEASRRLAPTNEHGQASGHTVFLSYADADRPVVEALREDLAREGIECWYDRSEVTGDERWEATILASIERCAVFVPILSRHVLAPDGRAFRTEWEMALERRGRLPKGGTGADLDFVVPSLVDDTQPTSEGIHEYFGALRIQRFPQGKVPNRFRALLKRAIRVQQKRRGNCG